MNNSSHSLPLGRSAISIVEEDKRCFACRTLPESGVNSHCIVPCHYNQRCYLKATHANATRKKGMWPSRTDESIFLIFSDGSSLYEWTMGTRFTRRWLSNPQRSILVSVLDRSLQCRWFRDHSRYVYRPVDFFFPWRFDSGYDDCSNDPCPSSTVCLDTKDGFSCICPPWQEDCIYSKRKISSSEDIDERLYVLRSLEYRMLVQEWRPMCNESG